MLIGYDQRLRALSEKFGGFFIWGMARSGMASAKFLAQHNIPFTAWDDGSALAREEAEKHGWAWGPFQGQHGCILLSPGIAPKALPDVTLTNDIGLFSMIFPEYMAKRAIGVTGTYGKSTLCAMLYYALSKLGPCALGGNFGIPIFDVASNLVGTCGQNEVTADTDPGWLVLELSSYQLEVCAPLPLHLGVLLNLENHHLERHGTLCNYLAIKGRIFHNAGKKLLPLSMAKVLDTLWRKEGQKMDRGKIFAPALGWNIYTEEYLSPSLIPKIQETLMEEILEGARGRGLEIPREKDDGQEAWPQKVAILEPHERQALRGALGISKEALILTQIVGKVLDLPLDVQGFCALAHRQEVLGTWGGIAFINDSKATNPASAAHALNTMAMQFPCAPIYWLCGGALQEDDLSPLLDTLPQELRHAYAMGQSGPRYNMVLSEAGVPSSLHKGLEEAFLAATRDALIYTKMTSAYVSLLAHALDLGTYPAPLVDDLFGNLRFGNLRDNFLDIGFSKKFAFPWIKTPGAALSPMIKDWIQSHKSEKKSHWPQCQEWKTAKRHPGISQEEPLAIILLSPGCASFDAFKDFERRGHVFRDLYHRLYARVLAS